MTSGMYGIRRCVAVDLALSVVCDVFDLLHGAGYLIIYYGLSGLY
jgi:hypothetical protein